MFPDFQQRAVSSFPQILCHWHWHQRRSSKARDLIHDQVWHCTFQSSLFSSFSDSRKCKQSFLEGILKLQSSKQNASDSSWFFQVVLHQFIYCLQFDLCNDIVHIGSRLKVSWGVREEQVVKIPWRCCWEGFKKIKSYEILYLEVEKKILNFH